MRLVDKIKMRFGWKSVGVEIDDTILLLGLELGWFEKFMGAWVLTDRGVLELDACLNANLDGFDEYENNVYRQEFINAEYEEV